MQRSEFCLAAIHTFYEYVYVVYILGECGLTILSAMPNDSGTWSCHMGATHVAKTDSVREISIRIAGNVFSHEYRNSTKRPLNFL